MKKISILFVALLFVSVLPRRSSAMDCYVDPVSEYAGAGNVISGVFMRNQACTSGSTVLATLAAGATVQVIGFTDGWYRVESNGVRGWVGQQFIQSAASETGKIWSSYEAYMTEVPNQSVPVPSPVPIATDAGLVSRMQGCILLQVQQHGEAWYVNPVTRLRNYMKDGATAYGMMRSFGLGIADKDLNAIPAVQTTDQLKSASSMCGTSAAANRVKGRILLQVQQHGEAYYVYPKNCRRIYLKDGAAAYEIMRFLGLGIADQDLQKIPAQ